jgi:hypothetical protein
MIMAVLWTHFPSFGAEDGPRFPPKVFPLAQRISFDVHLADAHVHFLM